MMLYKLNNPNFNTKGCWIFGTNIDCKSKLKTKPKHNKIWMPTDIWHSDNTMRNQRSFNDMSREELSLVKEYIENPLKGEEIIKKYSRYETEMKMINDAEIQLAEQKEKVNKVISRKNKDHLRMYEYQINDAAK